VLVDTTVCIGCRNCEWACKTAHDLPTGHSRGYQDRSVFEKMRRPDDNALTVVNRYDNPKDPDAPYTVKVQCMHCDHPACVSVCIVGAFSKQEDGAVVWDTDKCIGCRYCMVACPSRSCLRVPHGAEAGHRQVRFLLCAAQGWQVTGLCRDLPVEALTYGPREELVRVARDRTKRYPQRYVNHLFGEYEVGGTAGSIWPGSTFRPSSFRRSATTRHRASPRASNTVFLRTSCRRWRCTPCSAADADIQGLARKRRRGMNGEE